jgi:hypothetical protein
MTIDGSQMGAMSSEMSSFYGGDTLVGGERVRVAMRVRPMMPHEQNRGDENSITTPDN